MIAVFHLTRLTEDERRRLNAGGWDCEPRFSRYADCSGLAKPDAIAEAWSLGEYEHVADVDSDSLDTAFAVTNHIEYDWRENRNVTARNMDALNGPRSTSVGDIVRNDAGEFFIVAHAGFDPIDLTEETTS